jgi:hypothetical protein
MTATLGVGTARKTGPLPKLLPSAGVYTATWPRDVKGVVPYRCLWGPGFYVLIGAILFFVGIGEGGLKGVFFGMMGFVAIVPTFHWLFTHEGRAKELTTFRRSGDFQVWPFLRASEHEEAHMRSMSR